MAGRYEDYETDSQASLDSNGERKIKKKVKNARAEEPWRQLVKKIWDEVSALGHKSDKKGGGLSAQKDDGAKKAESASPAGYPGAGAKKEEKKSSSWFSMGSKSSAKSKDKGKETAAGADVSAAAAAADTSDSMKAYDVPDTFEGMNLHNARMVGCDVNYIIIVQDGLDSIVTGIAEADDKRIQVEADIIALRIHKEVRGHVVVEHFKMCMLASMRSLLPKSWGTDVELAWLKLWEQVAKEIERAMPIPAKYEKAVVQFAELFMADEDLKRDFGVASFDRLFAKEPKSEGYFRINNFRINGIVEQALVRAVNIYLNPKQAVYDSVGLGLRHIMYHINPEYFEAFIICALEELEDRGIDALPIEGAGWSLRLISSVMTYIMAENENAMLVAVRENSGKGVKEAVANTARKDRAAQMI